MQRNSKSTNQKEKKEKKDKNNIPDFSQTQRDRIPEAFTWKIDDIYSSIDEWEKDKTRMIELTGEIAAMEKDWAASPGNLLRFMNHVTEIEKIEDKTFVYTQALSDTDMGNSRWQAMKGEIQSADVNFQSSLSFVNPGILKLGRQKIDEYIEKEPGLKEYQMDFNKILRMEKHILSTDETKIIAETGLFSRATQKASGILNDVDMPVPQVTLANGKRKKLNQATYLRLRQSNTREDRVKSMHTYWRNRAQFKNTQAALLDGAIKNHYFYARMHHYNDCLDAALLPHNIEPQVYYTLLETVKSNLTPLHRYLELKSRLLKIDRLTYEDIYASAVPTVERTFTIEEAQELIIQSMRPLGPEYTDILARGFSSRWTDIYPNKGKRSGAYSQGSLYGLHPYVLLNYNGSFNHVSTLAHEFGHALHSWFSNTSQPYPMAHYPIFLAEIASTLNEYLLVHYLEQTETDDLFKLYILDQYIEEFRGTLYRQTIFADFELAMHQWVEKDQTLTTDWLDEKYLELTRFFMGHEQKVMSIDKYIEAEWSTVPHFYYNFYVYQYCTGIVAATALAQMLLKGDASDRTSFMNFLKSGYSRYPLEILADTGVDLTTSHPIELAIKSFNDTITRMEQIASHCLEKKEVGK